MQIDEATYNRMPERLQRFFAKLPNPGSAEVLAGFPVTTSGNIHGNYKGFATRGIYGNGGMADRDRDGDTGSAARFFYTAKASKQDRDEGCEGLELRDPIHGKENDQGGLSVSNACIPSRNHHPTVKPIALMRYLCRLVTPPNGTILDPFMGSGSTGKAAILEGFNFVGVELEQEYIEIAARRIEHACGKMGIIVEQPMLIESRRETVDVARQLMLL
jgi:site-specific DNA-methyltransferase (adenine-specific)